MSVADILEQLARNAGRARPSMGSVISAGIADAAQVPGRIMADRERQRLLADQQRRLTAQDTRQANADARSEKDQALQDTAAKTAIEYKAVVDAGLAAAMGDSGDPKVFDAKAALAKVTALGKPQAIYDVIAKHRESAPKLTSGAPGSFMRGEDGIVVPGSEIPFRKPDYTIGNQRFGGDGTAIGAPVPAAATHSPIYKEWQEHVTAGGKLTFDAYQTVDANRKRPVVHVNTGNPGDVKEYVAGMKDGSLPPVMPGRASKDYTAVGAEARRQGFDLAQANVDWVATTKHVATMNGAQQLRLNQAVNSLPEMLDNVDALATQWKGGRFPVLNRANLALAKGGAYGPDVASVANQLDAQIADVVADLGNVYMGGNSPTDHALKLAGKSLSAEWDGTVLRDMVKLAKKNVTIRQNSIKNTGVAGASEGNPYAPPAPAAAAPPAVAPGALTANTTQRVVQNGVTYEVTTDATGKVISSKVVR